MKIRNMMSALVVAATMTLALAGCAAPGYGGYNNGGYNNNGYGTRGGGGNYSCALCGTVEDVQQVYMNKNSSTAGTILGAVIGAAVGHQVGGGKGKTAATIGGAVAGGAIGHEVGQRRGHEEVAYRVSVRLNDGRYATVTQRENPGVRVGDYVEVRNDHVYRR